MAWKGLKMCEVHKNYNVSQSNFDEYVARSMHNTSISLSKSKYLQSECRPSLCWHSGLEWWGN